MGVKARLSYYQSVLSPHPAVGIFDLHNKGWELGNAGLWVFWAEPGDPLFSVEAAAARDGSYGLRGFGNQNWLFQYLATYTVTAAELALLKGKTKIFSAWLRDTLKDGYGFGTPSGYIRITDNLGSDTTTITWGSYGSWTQATVTRAIDANVTTVQFIYFFNPAQQNMNRDMDDMDVV